MQTRTVNGASTGAGTIELFTKICNCNGIKVCVETAAVVETAVVETAAAPVGTPAADYIERTATGEYVLNFKNIFPGEAAAPDTAAPGTAATTPRANTGALRAILSAFQKRKPNDNVAPIHFECGGAVIDTSSWLAVVLPPRAMDKFPVVSKVNNWLVSGGNYDVIEVFDGTVVTLYKWVGPAGPVWAMASSNGYDVSTLQRAGPLTFAEVFYELVTKLYPGFAAGTGISLQGSRLNFSNLDDQKCYTFGFRHHNFHPLRTDPERVWFIQSADTTGLHPQKTGDQSMYDIVSQPVLTEEQLGTISGVAAATPTIDEFLQFSANTTNPAFIGYYGYILRSRQAQFPDVLLSSAHLNRIRKLVYEKPPRSLQNLVTASNRTAISGMIAFLSGNREQFEAMFPEYVDTFKLYATKIETVVQLIIQLMKGSAPVPATATAAATAATAGATTGADPLLGLAKVLFAHISRHEVGLTGREPASVSIVTDYVMLADYAYLFLTNFS